MIRDPSDGSTKPVLTGLAALQAKYGPNWGLTPQRAPDRKPVPAPTKEELEAYYATHTLGGKPKEQGEK